MAGKEIDVGPTGRRVGRNIEDTRRARGMRLTELSDQLKNLDRSIPPNSLARIESGERRVDVEDLVAIAACLGTTVVKLFELSPAEKGNSVLAFGSWSTSREDYRALIGGPEWTSAAARLEGTLPELWSPLDGSTPGVPSTPAEIDEWDRAHANTQHLPVLLRNEIALAVREELARLDAAAYAAYIAGREAASAEFKAREDGTGTYSEAAQDIAGEDGAS